MKRLMAACGLAFALTASPAAAVVSTQLSFPDIGADFYTGSDVGEIDDGVETGLFTDTTHWLEQRFFQVEIARDAFNYVIPIRTVGLIEDAAFELLLDGVVIHDFTVAATPLDGYTTITGSGRIDPGAGFPPTGYDGLILRIQLKRDLSPGAGGVAFTAGGRMIFDAAAVPEPATWALLIVGAGLTGATFRRRRSLAAPEAAA